MHGSTGQRRNIFHYVKHGSPGWHLMVAVFCSAWVWQFYWFDARVSGLERWLRFAAMAAGTVMVLICIRQAFVVAKRGNWD